MITVEYLPADGPISMIPEGTIAFNTANEFVVWLSAYVCQSCLNEYKNFHDKEPKTVADWLWGGCGCEIEIHDPENMIDYETLVL